MSLELVLITQRMKNHAGASGYDRLADYLDAEVIGPTSGWTIPKRVLARSLRFLVTRSRSTWYHREELYSEVCASAKWFLRRGGIFHFLYGENSYRYLGNLKSVWDRNMIICTFHTPPDKFRSVVPDTGHLSRLNAAIVVSTTQQDFFCQFVGSDRVYYVPHGIDVQYYRPSNDKVLTRNSLKCLFVGTHLRDFETLAATWQFLNQRGISFGLSVVTSPEYHSFFTEIQNVRTYSGISDEELLNLYHDSDVLVCPLLDSTANNSLLEAMACGLPIVCTDVPGVRDYLDDSCCIFTPRKDYVFLANTLVALSENVSRQQEMRIKARKRSLDYSWQNVASKLLEVYKQVRSERWALTSP